MKKLVPRPFWLIVNYQSGGMEVLRINLASGEEALPVFSFEDEARMFLELGASDGWRVRETTVGELISLLYCLCASADRVVLDPLPGPDAVLNDLVSIGRGAFVEFVVEQGRSAPAAQISSANRAEAAGSPGARNGRVRRSSHCVPPDATAHKATLERR